MFAMRRRSKWLLLLVFAACSDTGLYAVGQGGTTGPDRAEILGRACVPLASGASFPVKVIYAVEGGGIVDRAAVADITDTLNSLAGRFSEPFINFDLVAYHTLATGLQAKFVPAVDLG